MYVQVKESLTVGVPAVLAVKPLTVPDRTVDVRLCIEREASNQGDGSLD